jgi:hypothetical protein
VFRHSNAFCEDRWLDEKKKKLHYHERVAFYVRRAEERHLRETQLATLWENRTEATDAVNDVVQCARRGISNLESLRSYVVDCHGVHDAAPARRLPLEQLPEELQRHVVGIHLKAGFQNANGWRMRECFALRAVSRTMRALVDEVATSLLVETNDAFWRFVNSGRVVWPLCAERLASHCYRELSCSVPTVTAACGNPEAAVRRYVAARLSFSVPGADREGGKRAEWRAECRAAICDARAGRSNVANPSAMSARESQLLCIANSA